MSARRNSLCKYAFSPVSESVCSEHGPGIATLPPSLLHIPGSPVPIYIYSYFIIHYMFFSCMFVLHSQIIWGMFSIFVLWSILRLAALCVVVRFLSALLLRVHMACYREVRVDSYSVLACLGFYFQKDRGLDLLTSEPYQSKILIQWASLSVECTE